MRVSKQYRIESKRYLKLILKRVIAGYRIIPRESECETMGLRDAIREYFERHPRAKKAIGVATAIAANFAIIASGSAALAVAASTLVKHQDNRDKERRNKNWLTSSKKQYKTQESGKQSRMLFRKAV
jgi:NAD-dependent SIR2 family protein deacetylase